ncbi:hypothetical protein EJ06DRAFT_528700 [Trichodelitschia bisporula]|uniref:Secreted protein n=1 Tax=Trichodelitschia bisporula TaxID=703511 RepID=A0A6G1I394_9PEZI|nr:hypothetical protein EJ06DRAFT_528700 [Trichodelitschia bisporula]
MHGFAWYCLAPGSVACLGLFTNTVQRSRCGSAEPLRSLDSRPASLLGCPDLGAESNYQEFILAEISAACNTRAGNVGLLLQLSCHLNFLYVLVTDVHSESDAL